MATLMMLAPGAACMAGPAAAQDAPVNPPVRVEAVPGEVAPVTPATASTPPRRVSTVAQSLVDRGIRLLGQNPEEAVAEFDAAIAIDPGIVAAWSNRGLALVHLNRAGEALESFNRADAISPDHVVTLRGRGVMAMNDNQIDIARDLLTRSLEIEPGDAYSLHHRAGANFLTGNPEQALIDNAAAIQDAPSWPLPYQARIMMLSNLGRTDEALAAVDTMLEAIPDTPYVLAAASQFLASMGQEDRAEALLATSLETGETPLALFASAQRRPIGETDLKLDELDRAIELAPQFVPALMLRGETLWMEYEFTRALADARRVIEIVPDQPEGYGLAGRVLVELNRRTEARRMAEDLVTRLPDNPGALMAASQVYRLLESHARADELLTRGVELARNQPQGVQQLLQRLQNRAWDDVEGRSEDVAAVLAIDPDNIPALYTRASVEAQRDQYPAAVATFRQIIALEGNRPVNTNSLGIALTKANLPAEAEAAFDQARALATTANDLNSICWNKVTTNVAIARALEECRASLALVDHTATRDSLAMALLRNGELEAALAEFDTVLAAQQLPTSQFARSIIRARLGDIAGARADAAAARSSWPEADSVFGQWGFDIPASIAAQQSP